MHLFYPKQIKFKKAWIVSASSLLPGVAVVQASIFFTRKPLKNPTGKFFKQSHTAAFKLGGLFDILALFSTSRINL